MTIWLLVLILLASLAGLGYRQGAIRVAFSFLGIVFGALLAVPLGRVLQHLLFHPLGVKDPLLAWALGPFIIFLLVNAAFKIAALPAHMKADVYYKYHAGDLRLALWERLHRRLGLCLGLLNGAAYLILLAFVISVPSYATQQVATSDNDPAWMRLLNRLGSDLHHTGFVKVARSIDSIPQANYALIDFGALIYRNPLAEARLLRYPGFLSLAERPEFQNIANDNSFTESWQKLEPIMNLVNNPNIQAIYNNPALRKAVWEAVIPDLDDVYTFLQSGRSPKYDPERILGRWTFNRNSALGAIRRAKPNINPKEMQRLKDWVMTSFDKTSFVATTAHEAILKSLPQMKLSANTAPSSGGPQVLRGQWKNLDGKYQFLVSGDEVPTLVQGDKLTIRGEGMDLVFDRED